MERLTRICRNIQYNHGPSLGIRIIHLTRRSAGRRFSKRLDLWSTRLSKIREERSITTGLFGGSAQTQNISEQEVQAYSTIKELLPSKNLLNPSRDLSPSKEPKPPNPWRFTLRNRRKEVLEERV